MQEYEIEQWFDIEFNNEIVYAESFPDYSWGYILIIFSKDGCLYVQDDIEEWSPRKISDDKALSMIADFELLRFF